MLPPGSKKPIVKIEGEWNGRMMAKWASGKNEVFIDVTKLPLTPKKVKPVKEQGRFESRRLWKDVTHGLKVVLAFSHFSLFNFLSAKSFSDVFPFLQVNDIDGATKAKFKLEQRQREEAAERKERKEAWETKLFMPIGENWQFMNPLEKRLLEKKKATNNQ